MDKRAIRPVALFVLLLSFYALFALVEGNGWPFTWGDGSKIFWMILSIGNLIVLATITVGEYDPVKPDEYDPSK